MKATRSIVFSQCTNLTFEQPDTKRFRNLALAYEAMYRGGNMPCIVNAANEVVVASFLKDGISFLGMSDVIEKTMERVAFIANPTYDDYVATDAEPFRIGLLKRQIRALGEIEPVERRADTVGVGECVLDGQAHIWHPKLCLDSSVFKLHHRVDD